MREHRISEFDYKNILARIYSRIIIIALGIALPLVITNYLLIDRFLTNQVNSVLKSESSQKKFYLYKEQLYQKVASDITKAREQFLEQMKAYTSLPYYLSPSGLTLFDSAGSSFRIEFGRGLTNTEILFKRPFLERPIVIVNLSDSNNLETLRMKRRFLSRGIDILSVSMINIKSSENGFSAFLTNKPKTYFNNDNKFLINWVAFGR